MDGGVGFNHDLVCMGCNGPIKLGIRCFAHRFDQYVNLCHHESMHTNMTLDDLIEVQKVAVMRAMHELLDTTIEDALQYVNGFFASLPDDGKKMAVHDDPVWLAFDLIGVSPDKWDGPHEQLGVLSMPYTEEAQNEWQQRKSKLG